MTTTHSIFQTRAARRLPFLTLLAATLVAACGTDQAAGPLQPSGTQGRVRFVNLINDTTRGRVNAILERLPFGVNLTYTQSTPISLAAPNTAPYAAILTGDRTLVLKRTADTSVTVASFTFNIVEGQDKSIYAIGGAAGSAITQFATVDTNPAPAATQVRVRVVHLSPTAGNVDVFVTAVGADLATATPTLSNVPYRGVSGYLTVAPGTYQVRVVPAGTAPAQRAANVAINVASLALTGGTGRTIVAADNTTGGAPLRAFVLTDR
ncbi:MAG TPA: DUF4397 domain-containing protein, partial [Gemmatimonadaceae bacterium]|nr:DUF4397 domain-containing protein [Gemmatimonadaceae bacterium]